MKSKEFFILKVSLLMLLFSLIGCEDNQQENFSTIKINKQLEIARLFYPNDTLKFEGYYIPSEKEFFKIRNYWGNGKVKREINLLKGFLNGPQYSYYENGQLSHLSNYILNLKDRVSVSFDEEGEISVISRYHLDKLEKEWGCYDEIEFDKDYLLHILDSLNQGEMIVLKTQKTFSLDLLGN